MSTLAQLLAQEELILAATEALSRKLSQSKLSRSALARKLKVDRSQITHILSGRRNLTLRTLADLADALDCDVSLTIRRRPR